MSLWTWIVGKLKRPPDFIIGGAERPYLLRWWLLPRNRWCNIYLHKFVRDDEDRALHDHPWASLSIVLAGGYWDITNAGRRWYGPGAIILRRSTSAHRVELAPVVYGGELAEQFGRCPAWTLFFTGPTVRESGFHCPKGWRHWKEFVDNRDEGAVRRGCD